MLYYCKDNGFIIIDYNFYLYILASTVLMFRAAGWFRQTEFLTRSGGRRICDGSAVWRTG